jgi:hypothetical protein
VRKAAGWCLLAAGALAVRVIFAERLPGTQIFFLLSIIGFGALLPPIATLHLHLSSGGRHAAVLATLAAAASVVLGLSAVLTDDLEPAALFFLGMWWWVVGKFAVQTGLLPRAFGWITAVASIGVLACVVGNIFGLGRWTWDAPLVALAAWLVALAFIFVRQAAPKQS